MWYNAGMGKTAGTNSYIVQIDNPGLERKTATGNQRWMLNEKEIELIKKRHLAQKILDKMVKDSAKIPEIAEALELDPYFIARIAYNEEAVRDQLVKQVVDMFLSLEPKPRSTFAKELGISHQMLKAVMESEQFALVYEDHFSQLTSDPTIKAVNSKLVEELLPKAYQQLNNILGDNNASASVRLKAALEVFRLSGIKERQVHHEDRQQLSEFLTKHNLNVTQVNINVPPDEPEIVDGEVLPLDEETQAVAGFRE